MVLAGSDHIVLLRSDGTAVACGCNSHGQCGLPPLVGALTYVPQLLPTLLFQASVDGGFVNFVTLGGVNRCQIAAAPGSPLVGVRDQLLAEHRLGRLGLGLGRVDAVLPGGRFLSEATAEETVQSAFRPAVRSPAPREPNPRSRDRSRSAARGLALYPEGQ